MSAFPPVTEDERAKIIEALKRGDKIMQIVEMSGRGEGVVRKIRAETGLAVGTTVKRPERELRPFSMEMPAAMIEALEAAARRRSLEPGKLACALLHSVLCKGHIDTALRGYFMNYSFHA
jgi:hypothetical protein